MEVISASEEQTEQSISFDYCQHNKLYVKNIPQGFVEQSEKVYPSVLSQSSKEVNSLNNSTSNLSDQYKVYKDRLQSSNSISKPKSSDRVGGGYCKNCVVY
ncbi:hypothetical protein SteCoe_29445 [Stentor coeruleus]|uniref:Uncharacterized protein n=1 Tax=Stentor coeruleus TaxID=5963 RepID=A0A1R2B5Y1_9CILI|nr:hypothetical protein SteCoe_29445 [Stentor coeruleus]